MICDSGFRPEFAVADWHLHASFYRVGRSEDSGRIEPMAAEGARLGLDMMGIGEHVNEKPKHPVERFCDLARDLARASLPLPVFLGTEADILDAAGRLSLPDGLRERTGLDYIIASVHKLDAYATLGQYLDNYHRLMMGAAAADNGADVIGHPWHNARALVESGMIQEWRFELVPARLNEELLDALASRGKAIEINCRSVEAFADPAYRAFVARARQRGVKVSVGSDAHGVPGMGAAVSINRFLAEMGFTSRDVWMPARAWEVWGAMSGRRKVEREP